jgi:hypothetical protein
LFRRPDINIISFLFMSLGPDYEAVTEE